MCHFTKADQVRQLTRSISPANHSLPDPRLASSKAAARARSINLAISHRGLCAINAIDPKAAQSFLQAVVPMRGRMIHHSSGNLDSQLYDRDGQVRDLKLPFLDTPSFSTVCCSITILTRVCSHSALIQLTGGCSTSPFWKKRSIRKT